MQMRLTEEYELEAALHGIVLNEKETSGSGSEGIGAPTRRASRSTNQSYQGMFKPPSAYANMTEEEKALETERMKAQIARFASDKAHLG